MQIIQSSSTPVIFIEKYSPVRQCFTVNENGNEKLTKTNNNGRFFSKRNENDNELVPDFHNEKLTKNFVFQFVIWRQFLTTLAYIVQADDLNFGISLKYFRKQTRKYIHKMSDYEYEDCESESQSKQQPCHNFFFYYNKKSWYCFPFSFY